MWRSVAAVVVLWNAACGEKPQQVADAALDGAHDAHLDGAPDAVDAALDAPIDAPSSSPRCATAPEMLVDVSPRRLANLAVSGNVLYYSAYELDGADVTNASVMAIDLTTEAEAAAPLTTITGAFLSAAGTEVYAADSTRVWSLRPGQDPVEIVTDRNGVRVATGDATHVYWAEAPTGGPEVVLRQLETGGPVESVMTCSSAMELHVTGGFVYCASLGGSIYYAPTTGGALDVIPYANGYPVHSMSREGSDLFFVNMYNNPQIHRAPLPSGPAVLVKQHAQLTRFNGLALSSDYFYVTGTVLYRIHRTSLETEPVFDAARTSVDPVIWNDELFFAAQNPLLSGDRYIMHCVD